MKFEEYHTEAGETNDFSIIINKKGDANYTKISYPLKYGIFSRLETKDLIFEFNLNNEIKHAKAKSQDWLNPSEWLKRTTGNDWIYYSTGGYTGVYSALGEYYLPNLMYPTNSLLGGKPFKEKNISNIIQNWHSLLKESIANASNLPVSVCEWLEKVKDITPENLDHKAKKLFKITGSRVTVLPPDTRHVDYNVIPLNISDGCLYKCRFCKVKNHKPFTLRSLENIACQLHQLKKLYGADIINYNAIFLGEHDALNAPKELIIFAAQKAYEILKLENGYMKGNKLFLFGSVDSLLEAEPMLFDHLEALPFYTFINVGLESNDPATLERIGKPITSQKVKTAFKKIQDINKRYASIEISTNFIMDDDLPDSHNKAFINLVREKVSRFQPKGTIYISPLKFNSPSREALYKFNEIKTKSLFPTFLYIIQRL